MSPLTQDLLKALLTSLPAILIAVTGLLIAWTNLSGKISNARKQSQGEHAETIKEVQKGNAITEETKHALNSQLDEWKEEFKKNMAAAVAAAHAAGVTQGQGDAARMKDDQSKGGEKS